MTSGSASMTPSCLEWDSARVFDWLKSSKYKYAGWPKIKLRFISINSAHSPFQMSWVVFHVPSACLSNILRYLDSMKFHRDWWPITDIKEPYHSSVHNYLFVRLKRRKLITVRYALSTREQERYLLTKLKENSEQYGFRLKVK